MELSDLFVSHKQVTPVEFPMPDLNSENNMIYFNLDRARTALETHDTEDEPVDNEENYEDWSVGYTKANPIIKLVDPDHKTSSIKDAPKHIENPISTFNLYDWISQFERSKNFGGYLSNKDLKGVDYKDAKGHRTFGYGLLYHPNGKYMDQVKSEWTQQELENLYKQTVDNTKNKVLKWAKSKNITLKENQIDALTSAVYNFGPKFLEWSVAKRIADNPNDEKIYDAWAKFSDHQAAKYPGLVTRRKQEADRYFNRA